MLQTALAWALRNGVRKGVVGGSGPWLVVAVAAGAMKFLSRPSKGVGGQTMLHLNPGDSYAIFCVEDPPRK